MVGQEGQTGEADNKRQRLVAGRWLPRTRRQNSTACSRDCTRLPRQSRQRGHEWFSPAASVNRLRVHNYANTECRSLRWKFTDVPRQRIICAAAPAVLKASAAGEETG